MKKLLCNVAAVLVFASAVGCDSDPNKNLKPIPPGTQPPAPVQADPKAKGGGAGATAPAVAK